jgi:hypothetical protein
LLAFVTVGSYHCWLLLLLAHVGCMQLCALV